MNMGNKFQELEERRTRSNHAMNLCAVTLGDRLRTVRKKAGLKQYEVADTLGMLHSTLSSYENGRRMPTLDNLVRLAAFYGVGVGHFVGD